MPISRTCTAPPASLWGTFNEFFIDCKAPCYYRRRSFSEASTQTTSKRTVSGIIVLYPSRCSAERAWPWWLSECGSQLSSQTQQRRQEKGVKALYVPAKHAAIFLHLPFGNFPRGCWEFAAVDPFFNEHLNILPELLSLEALPSAHLAEAQ